MARVPHRPEIVPGAEGDTPVITGICCLCLTEGPLSFEHVPPRQAFNSKRLFVRRGMELLGADLDQKPDQIDQRGSGGHTLCVKCNNDTGSWYGPAFVSWTLQLARILISTRGEPSLFYHYHVFPLRVLKQLACCFMSTCGPGLSRAHPGLRQFVLNRHESRLPDDIRFYVYFNGGNRARSAGISGVLDMDTGTSRVMAEFSFPPAGYVLMLSGAPPNPDLVDISAFARYKYNDWKHVELSVRRLPVFSFLPGDFRPREQVLREAAESGQDTSL